MDTHLELDALPHPDRRVRRLGFDLNSPYVEQVWSTVIGPSCVAVLRRLPVLWAEEVPARIAIDELAGSLGLGSRSGPNSRFARTLDRLTQFRFAIWIDEGQRLGVYAEVPPLSGHRLARSPEWTQRAHDRILGEHLDRLAGKEPLGAEVTAITSRLDRLQHPSIQRDTPTPALGR